LPFSQGRPDQVAGKNINPAEVTVSSILSESILVFDVKTTPDEARLKMKKNICHYAVSHNKKNVGLLSIKDLDS